MFVAATDEFFRVSMIVLCGILLIFADVSIVNHIKQTI